MDFRKKLEHLLNAECKDNKSNTPDFILADYLISCLDAFDQGINAREIWYGRSVNVLGITEPSDVSK